MNNGRCGLRVGAALYWAPREESGTEDSHYPFLNIPKQTNQPADRGGRPAVTSCPERDARNFLEQLHCVSSSLEQGTLPECGDLEKFPALKWLGLQLS